VDPRAEAAGDAPEARHARLLLDLVSTRLDRDPEIPLGPGTTCGHRRCRPSWRRRKPALVSRVASEYPQIRAAVAARRYATAYDVLGKWPEALWTG